MEILRTLEVHYEDMQDTSFTVEDGLALHAPDRNAKRPAQAAIRLRRCRGEGLLDAGGDLHLERRGSTRCAQLLRPQRAFRDADKGHGRVPRGRKGEIVFTADDAVGRR